MMGINGSYVMWTLPLKEEEHQAENVLACAAINGNSLGSHSHFNRLLISSLTNAKQRSFYA
jgi:hypothetical protein